ncbi:hypothetical protein JCM10450v2_006620 [Rhodotorula kratochvilovae]
MNPATDKTSPDAHAGPSSNTSQGEQTLESNTSHDVDSDSDSDSDSDDDGARYPILLSANPESPVLSLLFTTDFRFPTQTRKQYEAQLRDLERRRGPQPAAHDERHGDPAAVEGGASEAGRESDGEETARPSVTDKVAGGVERVVGRVTGDAGKEEEGQIRMEEGGATAESAGLA